MDSVWRREVLVERKPFVAGRDALAANPGTVHEISRCFSTRFLSGVLGDDIIREPWRRDRDRQPHTQAGQVHHDAIGSQASPVPARLGRRGARAYRGQAAKPDADLAS